MNKFNPFPALTTPFPLIFLSSLSISDEVALVANLGKTYLVKYTTIYNNTFLPKSPNILPRNPLDWFFETVEFYSKSYIRRHIVREGISSFSFCFAVRNNSCANSSS